MWLNKKIKNINIINKIKEYKKIMWKTVRYFLITKKETIVTTYKHTKKINWFSKKLMMLIVKYITLAYIILINLILKLFLKIVCYVDFY